MELILAIGIGLLTACGVYLLLRATIFSLIFGLALLGYAVNLFLFAMGRLAINAAPIIGSSQRFADPLPQALVLTAIVIGFAMTAFVVALALRVRSEWGDDRSEFTVGVQHNNQAESESDVGAAKKAVEDLG
jgi:multicomponent K+:H+ antiporter subunit C